MEEGETGEGLIIEGEGVDTGEKFQEEKWKELMWKETRVEEN